MKYLNRLSDDHKTSALITWVGMLISSLVALAFYVHGGSLTNPRGIQSNLILALFMQLMIWFVNHFTSNFGKSFLFVFLGTMLLPFLPLTVYMLAGVVLLLFLLFVFECSKIKLSKTVIASVFLFSLLYAAIVFASTSVGMGDAFIAEKVRQLSFNPDDLFFSSMSTMFANYGKISTGLNGLPWVHYHFLSSAVYGHLARFLMIEPLESFAYLNFIVFSPLLITACLSLVNLVLNENSRRWWLLNFIILGSSFAEPFLWSYSNHFISESFLMGLLLMCSGMNILVPYIRSTRINAIDFSYMLVYLPLIATGKISAGCIFTLSFLIASYLKSNIPFAKRVVYLFFIAAFGLVGYKLARTIPMKGLEVAFHWKHYQRALGPNPFPYFLLTMFPYCFLVLPSFFSYRREGSLSSELKTWYWILFGAFVLGYVALNLTIDSSGYYFSQVHAFIALPLIGLLLNSVDKFWPLYELIQSPSWVKKSEGAMVLFLAVVSVFYFLSIFPSELKTIQEIKGRVLEYSQYKNPYASQFQQIKEDPDLNFMVYVPKTETRFWRNLDGYYGRVERLRATQCVCMPFYIPILTGKPAVFGLPDGVSQPCYIFHRGYEAYSQLEYEQSRKLDYTDEEVCKEVKRLGFRGFYRVTQEIRKKVCD